MRCRFAFGLTSDGRLLVTMEALAGFAPGINGKFCVATVDDENTFIQQVVLAELGQPNTIELVAGVLLVVAGRQAPGQWISVTADETQLSIMGMTIAEQKTAVVASRPQTPLGFVQEEDLERVFLRAPLPLCMMAGPEHVITFINPAFVQIAGRLSEHALLGKTVREAWKDLEGQQFFNLLDRVYQTGEPFVGIEVPTKIYTAEKNAFTERYFDFVYHPVRDRDQQVCGILCQASDVTERALEKHVRESREEQLYRQWAELDAIYRDSPLGMCLIDAKTLNILRLNEMKSRLLGKPMKELVGRRIGEVSYTPHVEDEYRKVVSSKRGASFEVTVPFGGDPNKPRSFIWNLNPVFSPTGDVEAIASTVTDITEWPRKLTHADDNVEVGSV